MKQKYFFPLLILFSLFLVTPVHGEGEFTLDVPFEEGKKALTDQNYPKAIESFRKVLFVDRSNAEASFYLAKALEDNKQPERALSEYRIFLKLVKEKVDSFQEMTTEAQETVLQMEEELQKIESQFSFLEWNVLFLAGFLLVFFLYAGGNWCRQIVSNRIHDKRSQLGKLLVDNKWLSNKKHEIVDVGSLAFSIFFAFISLVVVLFAIKILWTKL